MSLITQGYGEVGEAIAPISSGYPSYADLQAFALSAGIVASTDDHLDYRRAITAAIRRWERDTGLIGLYSLSVDCPHDVVLAILSLGAFMLVPSKASASGGAGAVQSIEQDDLKIQFSSISTTVSHYSAQQLQFKAEYDDAVSRYRRLVIV